jgi:hypothetical protein
LALCRIAASAAEFVSSAGMVVVYIGKWDWVCSTWLATKLQLIASYANITCFSRRHLYCKFRDSCEEPVRHLEGQRWIRRKSNR